MVDRNHGEEVAEGEEVLQGGAGHLDPLAMELAGLLMSDQARGITLARS